MCGIAGVYVYCDPAPPVERVELLRGDRSHDLVVCGHHCAEVPHLVPLTTQHLRVLPNSATVLIDRASKKGRALGVADRVVFTGNVVDAKRPITTASPTYVTPSQGEGFGFVLLEAMARGIPVIASKVDGGREAVRDGQLGMLVDPGDKDELKRATFAALSAARGGVPTELEHFSFSNFDARAHALFGQVLAESPQMFGRA